MDIMATVLGNRLEHLPVALHFFVALPFLVLAGIDALSLQAGQIPWLRRLTEGFFVLVVVRAFFVLATDPQMKSGTFEFQRMAFEPFWAVYPLIWVAIRAVKFDRRMQERAPKSKAAGRLS